MGKPELIIRRGVRTLDLNDQVRFWLAQDFIPPAAQLSTQISDGSSSNRYNGGVLTNWKAGDGSLTFTVRLAGSSGIDIQSAVRAVTSILKINDHGNETIYLEYRPNNDVPQPIFGQTGTAARYEVIHGNCALGDGYLIGVRRNEDVNLVITLIVKPFRMGRQQQLCTATGGILENLVGSSDGNSRGLIVPEATTNKFTNPVFNHATWNTGWTAGSSLVAAQNIDSAWLIPGAMNSARLSSFAATNNTYTASLNAGNTNKHSLACYARLQDGGVISATQMQLYYNAALTTTFTALGNGWYLLRAENFNGINAATATGVLIKNGYTVFVSGFQLEEKAYGTPIGWGDRLGWAWTGTQNASTSTRTAGSVTFPNNAQVLAMGPFTIRVIWRSPSTLPGADGYIFDARDGSNLYAPYLKYISSTGKLGFAMEFASALSDVIVADRTYVIHCVFTGATMSLYVDGVSVGSGAVSSVPTLASTTRLGATYAGSFPLIFECRGLATFDLGLSAAQVLADYTDIAPAVTRGDRIDAIPYLWTLGGDNVLSLDTGKQPLGIVGSVPGTVAAITEIQGQVSAQWASLKSIALSSYACELYLGLGPLLYDYSGAAAAGDYGGEHKTTTVNGADIILSPVNPVLPIHIPDQINGMEYYTLVRLFGSAATVFNLYSAWSNSSGAIKSTSRATTPASAAAYRMFRTNPNVIEFNVEKFTGKTSTQIANYIYGSKITSNVDISVDYIALLPRPCLFISGGRETATGFKLKGIAAYHVVDDFTSYPLITTGDEIQVVPHKLNHLLCYFCPDGTVDPDITYATTFSAIYIIPRWTVL